MADGPNITEVATVSLRNRGAEKKRAMAFPKTKSGKQAKLAKVFQEAKQGELHSGSKTGPIVTNPKQAQAIALSEAGMSRNHGSHNADPPNKNEVYNPSLPGPAGPHGVEGLLAGSGGPTREETRRPYGYEGTSSHFRRGQPASGSHGFGHGVHQCSGGLRNSGHVGAHRLGQRGK